MPFFTLLSFCRPLSLPLTSFIFIIAANFPAGKRSAIWYTAFDDPVALLRAESKVKTPWIVARLKSHGLTATAKVLDVGCGAGFLTNALAEEGFVVTGVDLSEESLQVAHKHDASHSVQYVSADAYHLPFADNTFDAVTALDFLEHVEEPQKVIAEISRVLKPGGLFFFHTFNRNLFAWLVIIKLVEWFVKNTPKNMHVLRLFVTPQELSCYCTAAGLDVKEITGLKPVFSSIPLKSIFTGVVPESLRFELQKSLMLSYLGYSIKKG
jgi:2-polyprenyl-6-hydroxyphenyl methylase/3-demethylubiquinone-9 3-methyltransferase